MVDIIHIINSDGTIEAREMTAKEVKKYTIPTVEWHLLQFPVRLIVSEQVQKQLIDNKSINEFSGSFPEAQFLLNHFKERNFDTVFVDSTAYVYLNSVLPEHIPYLNKYSIIIENK